MLYNEFLLQVESELPRLEELKGDLASTDGRIEKLEKRYHHWQSLLLWEIMMVYLVNHKWYYNPITNVKHIDNLTRSRKCISFVYFDWCCANDTQTWLNGNNHHRCLHVFVRSVRLWWLFCVGLIQRMVLGDVIIMIEMKKKKIFIWSQKLFYSMINSILIKVWCLWCVYICLFTPNEGF